MATLVLKDHLGCEQAVAQAEILRGSLQPGEPLEIDAGGLVGIDGCGLQLLAVAVRAARGLDAPVDWKKVSNPLQEAADLLGLTEELGL